MDKADLEYLATELHGWKYDACFDSLIFHRESSMEAGDYLLTGNGMLETLERMRERGWIVECTLWPKPRDGYAECRLFLVTGTKHYAQADTVPEAVSRAAVAALNGDSND